MESVITMMKELERCSNLIADAIIRRTVPREDDISENQARQLYGDKWLRRMKKEGLAVCHRIGGRNIFSRHQLNCLREAEREHAKLVFKKIGKTAPE